MATSEEDEAERENSDVSLSLGATLKSAREAQELSVEEIAAELRISVPFLNALEDGEFEVLGAPVFAKGYLKQYGSRLGLDVRELVADYDRTVGDQSIEIAPSKTIKLRDERQITVWIVAALVLAVIAGVIWFWWWLGTSNMELPSIIAIDDEVAVIPDAVETPTRLSSQTQARTQTEPAPEPEIGAGSVEAAPIAETNSVASEPRDVPPTISAPDETDPEKELEASAGRAADSEAYIGPELEIVFVADSWTEITAESGETLFYNLGRAGSSATVPADRDMNLFFGNAAGVELRIDGEPYAIPATARRRGNTAQWDLAARVAEPDTDD